jgi:integrase
VAKLERGESGMIKRNYPIRKFFDEYLQWTEMRHSASYHERNDLVIRNFKRFLDERMTNLSRLSQIKPHIIEDYQAFRLSEKTVRGIKPVTKRTVNIEVSSLKTFLNQAVKWEMLSSNPLADVDYLKEDDSKKIKALTENQVKKLLEEANGWFRPVLLTALYTGLREGEIIHLEWDDVDFKKRVIHIRRKDGWLPKSSGIIIRERDVAISKALADYLREYKNKGKFDDNRVFHNKYGEPLSAGLRKVLTRLTEKCGFSEITQFHALRHTYTTHLIKACKDPSVVQQQLGHSDIRTTMKYSDVTEERKRKAAESLDFGLK